METRIAIPQPTSKDLAYNRLNWPAYADAVRACGGEPVEFSLSLSPRAIAELANSCQGIILPGSPADVNPGKYGQETGLACAPADPERENVDELLLQDAHNLYKPILGVCFGTQILNVWRSGTLVQDLTSLPVNHSAARGVSVAHTAVIAPGSLLDSMVDRSECDEVNGLLRLPVNSSHHQAIGVPGDGLLVSGRCPQDAVVEAVEGGQAGALPVGQTPHFVLGVQWHPERTRETSATSRAIFVRFLEESRSWVPRLITTSTVR